MSSGTTPRTRLVALESHLLDRVEAAVLVVDLEGIVLFANPYCEVLYGRRPDEMVGEQARDFALEPLTPELITEIATAIRDGVSWEGEFRVERGDGTGIDVHAIDSPVFDDEGKVAGVISLAFDVTAQRDAQDELRRMTVVTQILRDIGATLTSELDIERLTQTVTDAARRLTGAAMGAFLQAGAANPEVRTPDTRSFVVGASSGKAREESIGAEIALDGPLLAALAHVEPTRFDDVTLDAGLAALLDVVMRSPTPPLRSCIAMPVRSRGGEVVGAMLVAHPDPARFTVEEERLLAGIAGQAGIALDIARLFRAAEAEIEARRRAEQVQRFYAETSVVLSSSLDYPESFERVGRLCVPFLADLCLIDVAEEHAMRRLAAVHADPEKEALVAELEKRYPPDPYGAHPAASVVRGGDAVVSGRITDDFLRATTRDARHLEIVKELDFRSYMCVPLEARGRRLGALTLVSSGSGRRFDAADLALAEEFGRRAALALDNARLYSERDHVARALQSSLLPPSLPVIPGVRLTARYRAAGEGNEVGGDFYHAFQVDKHTWWFVIGDVSGKGPEAAAIAGLARHTLRAVALHERSPRLLLEALHETLLREGRGELCTVCSALLRPIESGAVLSVACGGHPPPIVRRADGTIETPTCTGPLLGVPVNVAFEQQLIPLGPGDTVVLYTDGVTEAHHRNQELFGEARLIDVISHAADDVDSVADDILAAVTDYGPAEPRDDVAVVVLQIETSGQ